MLTWMGFVAKIVEFAATEMLKKQIELEFDEKNRACKKSVRFFHAFDEMELILNDFIEYLEMFSSGEASRIYRNRITPITDRLAKASGEFVESLYAFVPVICVYEPSLSNLFYGRVHARKDFVNLSSFYTGPKFFDGGARIMSFETTEVSKLSLSLQFTTPSDNLMNMNLQDIPALHSDSINDPLVIVTQNEFTQESIGPDERDKLIKLHESLQNHQSLIIDARDQLRKFIRTNFTLEDLLYTKCQPLVR